MTKRPARRAYSTAFPAGKAGARYLLDAIPADLWRAVRAKAKRDHTSIRALILSLLAEWEAR